MPNVSASSIRTALNTNLTAVSEIKQVVIGRTEVIESYPAARIYLQGVGDQMQDTNNQYRTYRFGVDVIQIAATDALAKATSEATFQDAIDAVLDKLNTQWSMASVELSLVEQGVVVFEDAGKGPQLRITLTWSAKTLISLS